MKTAPHFNWRFLLAAERWKPFKDAISLGYARGCQRIIRNPVPASLWFYYPDTRSNRNFAFRRLTSALRSARKP